MTFRDPATINLTEVNVSHLTVSPTDNLGVYKHAPDMYRFCQDIGAHIVNIPEYETYFVYWLPDNWDTLEEQRLLILLHGKEGAAYSRINHVYATAAQEDFGMVSIQWVLHQVKSFVTLMKALMV